MKVWGSSKSADVKSLRMLHGWFQYASTPPAIVLQKACGARTDQFGFDPSGISLAGGPASVGFGHYWHNYLLFEVSGQWGDAQ
jgi:hypothetical protein